MLDRSSKKTVPKSIVMLGDSPLAGRPGIGVRFTLSRTPDSYWPSWLASLAGRCPIKESIEFEEDKANLFVVVPIMRAGFDFMSEMGEINISPGHFF